MKKISGTLPIQVVLSFLFLLSTAGGATEIRVTGQVLINSEPAAGAVVYLEPAGGQSLDFVPDEKTIQQKKLRFEPDFLVVPAGTTLLFENLDDEIHNIHSKSQANRFDTGAHMPGAIKKITLKNPGAVPLRCRTHEGMRGLVYVTPSPFFSVTDGKGGFKIQNVPAGNYRITAWHPRLTPEEQAAGTLDVVLDSGLRTVSLRLGAKAAAGSDLTGIPDQDWRPIADQIQKELERAIALWKEGKVTSATSKAMSTNSRLYGESGLREAIARRLGRDPAAAHEGRLDLFRKQIQGIGGVKTTEADLQKKAEEIVGELKRDAERLNR